MGFMGSHHVDSYTEFQTTNLLQQQSESQSHCDQPLNPGFSKLDVSAKSGLQKMLNKFSCHAKKINSDLKLRSLLLRSSISWN